MTSAASAAPRSAGRGCIGVYLGVWRSGDGRVSRRGTAGRELALKASPRMHLLNPRRPWRRAAPFCLALLGLLPAAARAQPTASDRAWNLATNSMIGGVAAAVRATI